VAPSPAVVGKEEERFRRMKIMPRFYIIHFLIKTELSMSIIPLPENWTVRTRKSDFPKHHSCALALALGSFCALLKKIDVRRFLKK
jgi:hypothetical protein